MAKLELMIFDMDGVIFEGKNFWLDLHKIYKTEIAALNIANRYMKKNYNLLSKLTVECLWADKSCEPFFDLIENRNFMPFIKELFEFLRAHYVKTAIVSSGPYQLAERAQRILSVDVIRANHVITSGKGYSGVVDVQVDDSNKGLAATEIMNILKTDPASTAAIGDSSSDADVMKHVSCKIAFNTDSKELQKKCRYYVNSLQEIAPILKGNFENIY